MPTAFAADSVVERQESELPNVQVALKSPLDAAETASDLRQHQQESNISFPVESNVGQEPEDHIDDPKASDKLNNNTNGAPVRQKKVPPEAVRSSTRTRKRPFNGDMVYDEWSSYKNQHADTPGASKSQ